MSLLLATLRGLAHRRGSTLLISRRHWSLPGLLLLDRSDYAAAKTSILHDSLLAAG